MNVFVTQQMTVKTKELDSRWTKAFYCSVANCNIGNDYRTGSKKCVIPKSTIRAQKYHRTNSTETLVRSGQSCPSFVTLNYVL
ncbi:UNVERIFIED_CONTAM: hypothetical protein FKN15_051718 [Acipenser sinensis]